MSRKKALGERLARSPFHLYYDFEASDTDYGALSSVTVNQCGKVIAELEDGFRTEVAEYMLEVAVREACKPSNYLSKHSVGYVKLIAHNGGRYDHLFLIGHLFTHKFWVEGWKILDIFVVQQSSLKFARLTRMVGQTQIVIDLVDTYAIFPAPLWQYGQVLGLQKLEVDSYTGDIEKVRHYRRRDVEILERYCWLMEDSMYDLLGGSCFGEIYSHTIFTQTQLAKMMLNAINKQLGNQYGFNNRWYPVGGNMKLWENVNVVLNDRRVKEVGLDYVDKRVTTFKDSSPLKNMSLSAFTKAFPNIKVDTSNVDSIDIYSGLGPSRIGGLVHISEAGIYAPGIGEGGISELDVNSMYPSIMTRPLAYNFEQILYFPSLDTLKDMHKQGLAVFAMCQYSIPHGIPIAPIPVKTGVTIRPTGDIFTGRFELFDLIEYVIELGGKVKPVCAIVFNKEPIFRDFALHCWKMRQECKAKGDLAGQYIYKIFPNAISGLCGRRPENDSFDVFELHSFGDRRTVMQENISPTVQPHTYTNITTAGQCMMLDIAYANFPRVKYIDTDGFKFTGDYSTLDLCGLKVGDGLGELKLEYNNVKAYLFDLKVYSVMKKAGVWDVKMKAIPEQAITSSTTVTPDGKRVKNFDIERFLLLMDGYTVKGLRGIESIVQILANIRTIRESIPEDIWNGSTSEGKARLIDLYYGLIQKGENGARRSPLFGLMPIETTDKKSMNKWVSTGMNWYFNNRRWYQLVKEFNQGVEQDYTQKNEPHRAQTLLINSYNYLCRKCGQRSAIVLNIHSGLRCSICDSGEITVSLVSKPHTHIYTMTPEFLRRCGYDEIVVKHMERNMWAYRSAEPQSFTDNSQYTSDDTYDVDDSIE